MVDTSGKVIPSIIILLFSEIETVLNKTNIVSLFFRIQANTRLVARCWIKFFADEIHILLAGAGHILLRRYG